MGKPMVFVHWVTVVAALQHFPKKRHRIVFAFCDIGLQEICCVIALFAVHHTYILLLSNADVFISVNVRVSYICKIFST